jgi:hypothetical protein
MDDVVQGKRSLVARAVPESILTSFFLVITRYEQGICIDQVNRDF